ncbi:polysaccharide lyase family 9 protein [Auriculariales sp. MPI-PUGE-AT-0066]|nr:polysaccharide lyase family 9 protein [Auriculariales sp. MPI-PUGE-AT-0066]
MVSLSTLLGRRAPRATRSAKQKRATSIYVATTGSDSNAGTLAAPLLSIQAAVDKAVAGDTIYLRAGTYYPTVSIKFNKSGTSSAKYTITNYNSEKVIVDGENMPYTPGALDSSIPNADRGIFHIEGSYWRFIGLELIHGPYGIFARDASNNLYERLITRDNYETGLQIQGTASNNLVLNVDTYGNHDPRKNGESADGIGIKEGSGTGNIVRGLRTWNNVDDGLDFWLFESPITVENAYSWGNGVNRWNFTTFEGDGNGFKLGGGGGPPAAHVIRNSIAFQNAQKGFTDNSQEGDMVIAGNTAWKNSAGVGFQFTTAAATLTANIAVNNGNGQTSLSGVTQSNNSWTAGTWNDASFVSTSSSILTGARLANGSIVANNFLLPATTAPNTAIGARIYGV